MSMSKIIFIGQSFTNKTWEEVMEERLHIKEVINDTFAGYLLIIQAPAYTSVSDGTNLSSLAESIKNISECDMLIFSDDYYEDLHSSLEHDIAMKYKKLCFKVSFIKEAKKYLNEE